MKPMWKDAAGTFRLERQERRRKRVSAEDDVIADAKKRDGYRCRFWRCRLKLVLHGSHLERHRGMGGNPLGDRTTLDNIITQCARHHQLFDHDDIDIRPLTNRGADGPCEFWERHGTEWVYLGAERTVQVSETRAQV